MRITGFSPWPCTWHPQNPTTCLRALSEHSLSSGMLDRDDLHGSCVPHHPQPPQSSLLSRWHRNAAWHKTPGYTLGFFLKIPDIQTWCKIPVLSNLSFLNGCLWVCSALWLWTSSRAGQCIPCRSVPHSEHLMFSIPPPQVSCCWHGMSLKAQECYQLTLQQNIMGHLHFHSFLF